MTINSDRFIFDSQSVSNAPDAPGVYALWNGDALIYYGSSEISIRERLIAHHSGAMGRCTQSATAYQREVTAASHAQDKEAYLLTMFKARYGAYPRCNDRSV